MFAKYDTYNFTIALLMLFIKSMGDGFSEVIGENYNLLVAGYDMPPVLYRTGVKIKRITPNNFKQKIKKLNSGDKKVSFEIEKTLYYLGDLFYAPSLCTGKDDDKTDETFCEEMSNEKYYYNFKTLIDSVFTHRSGEHFFYESFEDALSYILVRKFNEAFKSEKCVVPDFLISEFESEFKRGLLTNEEYECQKNWEIRCFRHEYGTSMNDVRFNKKENRTFFKWAIDEFYKNAGNADEIVKYVFGENDGSVSTSFEKLKYESGKRKWKTFEKLFKNELKDNILMDLLKDDETLKAYEIFQSRMLSAYFLENFFAELPKFVGRNNTNEIKKIIVGDESAKRAEDFLIKNHEAKTKDYENIVFDIAYDDSFDTQKITSKFQLLDPNCLATETMKSYCSLLNPHLSRELPNAEINSALEICRKNMNFLSVFGHYLSCNLNGIIWN